MNDEHEASCACIFCELWSDLAHAAEDYTKWFDGAGTATKKAEALRAAAVAYADALRTPQATDTKEDGQ